MLAGAGVRDKPLKEERRETTLGLAAVHVCSIVAMAFLHTLLLDSLPKITSTQESVKSPNSCFG